MNTNEIIKNIICTYFVLQPYEIKEDTNIKNEFDVDHIDMSELFELIGNEFDIKIPIKDHANLKTFSDIKIYIEKEKAA